MLLVAIWPKLTETLANGYSSESTESTERELSNEYQHDGVWMIFIIFCVLVNLTKVTSALEGLSIHYDAAWTDLDLFQCTE